MKIILIPVAIIALIVSATLVHAKQHHHKNPDKIVERVTEKLSLEGHQQAALRVLIEERQKLRTEQKAQRQARKAQFERAKESGELKNKGPFAELAVQEQISVADINRVIDEKQAKHRENRQPVLQAFVDFRNSLTAEQRQQAKPVFRKLLRGVMASHGGKYRHHQH